ncbi:MAG: hypothetical protein ACF8LL_02920 [Phycisphaerales bacterium]
MPDEPSTNGANGRDTRGRFAKGNAGGPGNPLAGRVARLRSALIAAVTDEDMEAVARKLVSMAKEGDVAAIRELLSRTLGKPHEADLLERIESLEERLAEQQAQ